MLRKTTLCLTLSSLIVLFLIPIKSLARIYLFDKKLEITGKLEEKVAIKYNMKSWEKGRSHHGHLANGGGMDTLGMLKTHFHIDGLLHLYQGADGTVLDVYTLWEWFYDFAPDISGDMHRGMATRDRNRYQTPHGVDMCRELYANFVSGPWTLRAGKQMIVWGETSLQRTADVVNPLDISNHMMGMDDWEDFRKGLWMFRGFYETDFKNNLTFEIIWIPHDIQVMSMPVEGGLYSTSYSGGFFSEMMRRWKYDEPKARGLHDSQGGIRIRGYNFDWDWTVLWYNGFDATPIVDDWGQRGSGSYGANTPDTFTATKGSGLKGFNLYAASYNSRRLYGTFDLPAFPTGRQFRYFRTDNFAATATKYFHHFKKFGLDIPIESVVRMEFAYKEGVHFNTLKKAQDAPASNWAVTGRTQRDILAYAIEIDHDWMPEWICKFNGRRSVNTTLGFFQDWIFNHDHTLSVNGLERGYGDKNSTSFSLSVNTDWMGSEIYTMASYGYNTNGNGFVWALIQYGPGDHWRFLVLPRISWSNVGPKNHKVSRYTERSDTTNYITFKIIYQF
ncbi:MAG: DUF1302 family protein [Thermodesulfobacteriota bacterium]